jgi:hypothetical protein
VGRDGKTFISDNTINSALKRLGYGGEQTAHGFRATARTMLDEILEQRVDFIEHQLAHKVKDNNGTAYNRTKFLNNRREMMQEWADYLESLLEPDYIMSKKKACHETGYFNLCSFQCLLFKPSIDLAFRPRWHTGG